MHVILSATCFEYILCLSQDTTLCIWDVRVGRGNAIVSAEPRHILYGHDNEVMCVAVSTELDLAVSGSKDGHCHMHSLLTGRFIRHFPPSKVKHISSIALSVHGYFVVFCQVIPFCVIDAYSSQF